MQMYGMFYYGICDTVLLDTHREKAKLADELDMRDFFHSNSPYMVTYIRPEVRASLEAQSMPLVSGEEEEDLSSASAAGNVLLLTKEPHADVEASSNRQEDHEDIDEYGTNVVRHRRTSRLGSTITNSDCELVDKPEIDLVAHDPADANTDPRGEDSMSADEPLLSSAPPPVATGEVVVVASLVREDLNNPEAPKSPI